MTRKIEKNGKHKFDTTARHGKESPTSSSRNFLSAHEKVMKFLERQGERERDSGGVEAVVRRSISTYLPLRVYTI